jgi:hypothetical protein
MTWHIGTTTHNDGAIAVLADEGRVARVDKHEDRDARAALIAAAPDLLACCKRALRESARVRPDFMEQLLVAIAKAEGKL